MQIADQDIGGARVRRQFSRGSERTIAGSYLSAEEVLAMPVANRRALADAGYIEIFPRRAVAEDAERIVVRVGKDQYDVVVGVKLNDEPLSKDEAEALAKAQS